jgi:hypothetical protein
MKNFFKKYWCALTIISIIIIGIGLFLSLILFKDGDKLNMWAVLAGSFIGFAGIVYTVYNTNEQAEKNRKVEKRLSVKPYLEKRLELRKGEEWEDEKNKVHDPNKNKYIKICYCEIDCSNGFKIERKLKNLSDIREHHRYIGLYPYNQGFGIAVNLKIYVLSTNPEDKNRDTTNDRQLLFPEVIVPVREKEEYNKKLFWAFTTKAQKRSTIHIWIKYEYKDIYENEYYQTQEVFIPPENNGEFSYEPLTPPVLDEKNK